MGVASSTPCDRLRDRRCRWSWTDSLSDVCCDSWLRVSSRGVDYASHDLCRSRGYSRVRELCDVESDGRRDCHGFLGAYAELEVSFVREWIPIAIIAKKKYGVAAAI